MDIKISIEVPSRATTRIGLLLGLPLAVLLGAQWVARADYSPALWQKDEVLSADKLNGEFKAIQAELSALRAQQLNPRCPAGFAEVEPSVGAALVVCSREGDAGPKDEMVRVGTGSTTFWMDRYEASLWSAEGESFGTLGNDDIPAQFPRNGQFSVPLFARSAASRPPSRNLTWFQADAACRLSGKRLPTSSEWIFAASGTLDPGASNGIGGSCVTSADGPRLTGLGLNCQSVWGAQDMIGNLWEWVAEWHAGAGVPVAGIPDFAPWDSLKSIDPGSDYKNDSFWGVEASSYAAGVRLEHSPAAAMRGGGWGDVERAGIFSLFLGSAPAHWYANAGFRCVIPR